MQNKLSPILIFAWLIIIGSCVAVPIFPPVGIIFLFALVYLVSANQENNKKN